MALSRPERFLAPAFPDSVDSPYEGMIPYQNRVSTRSGERQPDVGSWSERDAELAPVSSYFFVTAWNGWVRVPLVTQANDGHDAAALLSPRGLTDVVRVPVRTRWSESEVPFRSNSMPRQESTFPCAGQPAANCMNSS